MTDAVEFDVQASAEGPKLEGQEASPPEGSAETATALMPVPGWTAPEAARVVGGAVANVTLMLYALRHHAPPAPELWPAIAGDPEREFPLMGAGLAPVLDFIAPKGSLAAIGVSLTAGLGELIGAMARRAPVLATPPPPKAQPGPAAAAEADPRRAAAPSEEGGGFRYQGDQLRVLREAENPLVGFGVE